MEREFHKKKNEGEDNDHKEGELLKKEGEKHSLAERYYVGINKEGEFL